MAHAEGTMRANGRPALRRHNPYIKMAEDYGKIIGDFVGRGANDLAVFME